MLEDDCVSVFIPDDEPVPAMGFLAVRARHRRAAGLRRVPRVWGDRMATFPHRYPRRYRLPVGR